MNQPPFFDNNGGTPETSSEISLALTALTSSHAVGHLEMDNATDLSDIFNILLSENLTQEDWLKVKKELDTNKVITLTDAKMLVSLTTEDREGIKQFIGTFYDETDNYLNAFSQNCTVSTIVDRKSNNIVSLLFIERSQDKDYEC